MNFGVDKESRPEAFGLLDGLLTASIHTLLNIVEAKEVLTLKILLLILMEIKMVLIFVGLKLVQGYDLVFHFFPQCQC